MMSNHAFKSTAAAAAIAAFGSFAFSDATFAQVCTPGAFTRGPIATVTTTNDAVSIYQADIAYNSADDEFLIVWSGYNGSDNQVWGQRVSPRRGYLGNNFLIADSPASQTEASIVYNEIENQYLVTWRYQNGPPGSPGFNNAYGRIVNADGTTATPETQLYDAGLEATLAYNPIANEYVLHARNFAGTGGGSGIKAIRIDADGQPITPGTVIATVGAPAPAGGIAFNSNDQTYLSTWRDQTAEDLKGRLLDANLTPITNAFVISDTFPNSGLAASVAFDPVNDMFLVAFAQFSGGPVYGRFVSGDGTPVGSEFLIHDTPNRNDPYIAYHPLTGLFFVAWFDSSESKIRGQLLSADGSRAGGQLTLTEMGASSPPRVAVDLPTGGFVVAWDGNNPQTGDQDVALARVVDVRKGADFAKPFGKITQKDASVYRYAFKSGDLIADLAEPFGTLDGADIDAFRALLLACR